jgi:hypothetical protein
MSSLHSRTRAAAVLVVLAMAAASAAPGCGPRKDGSDGGRGPTDLGLPDLPEAAGDRLVCTQKENLVFEPIPVDMLILFDRSASMAAEFGDGTRFSVESKLLATLLPGYENRIRFGFQAFPARAPCGPGFVLGCCAEPPAVPVGPGTVPGVVAAIEDAAPVGGNTPTALALRFAREYFAGLNDGVSDRYVLLSTDGRPTCTASGQLPDDAVAGVPQACADALAETDALLASGVKVIVLGVGAELAMVTDEASACLEEIARRGGAARSDGPPAFFTALAAGALEVSLKQIFGGTAQFPCLVELKKEPADRSQVRVLFDGKEIPRNRLDGWDFDPPSDNRRIKIFGTSCLRLDRLSVSQVEVQYGCPPCEAQQFCE